MIEMIEDYIKRSKYPTTTVEKVLADMYYGMTFTDEDGFMVLSKSYDEMHVVHCYVKPGNKELFKKFIEIADEAARYFKCRVVLFTTMRPKGFSQILDPHGYKPQKAVIFGKEVAYEQKTDNNHD